MTSTADFWDKAAEKYAKSPMRDVETYNEKLEITRRYFRDDSRVYEFGCGTGSTAIAHAAHVQQIVATDISSKMIEIAKDKAAAAAIENIEFKCETPQECSLADESIDVVMAHNILHLLENPSAAIGVAHRVLKPGGVFVTSTACLGDALSLWRPLLALGQFFGKVPYVNVLKRDALETYFRDAGFEVDFEWHRQKMSAFIILKKPMA